MHHIDNRSEPLEQFGIAVPEFLKCLGLLLKYVKDRIGVVAAIDPVGEWVITEIFPCLFGVLRQGSIKKRLEVGGYVGCIGSRGHGGDVGRFVWEGRGWKGEIAEVNQCTALRRVMMISKRPACCVSITLVRTHASTHAYSRVLTLDNPYMRRGMHLFDHSGT